MVGLDDPRDTRTVKPLLQKLWTEPAAFIGLVVTAALAIGAVITGSDWTWEAIVAIVAPLLTGLGIRETVVPLAKATPVVVDVAPEDASPSE